MALTYTPDEINQMRSQFQALRAPAPQQQQQNKGNFLTHLLPAIGGTAGGIGGGALGGATIGTAILPGIGTAVGGLLGALAGGAAGGAAGKVGENAIEHQALGNGVAGQAIENGVLSAGPWRLLKGAGVATKVLAGLGDNSVAADVAAQGGGKLMQALNAGGQAAKDSSITGTIGKAFTKNADKMTAKQFSLTPTQQFNFKNLHGEDATQTLRNYNVTSPEQIGGHIDNLQNSFNDVVHNIPSMKIGDVNTALTSKYQPLLDSPNLTEQALGKQLKAQADEIMGHLSNKANGGDLVSASDLNALRGNFDNSVKYTLHGSPEMNTAKETADTLRGLLQQSADNAGVKTADGKSFKEVGLELSKLHNLDTMTGRQAYTGGGNPVKLTDMLAAGTGAAAGGPVGAMLTAGATHAINSPTGKKLLVQGSLKVGDKLANKAAATKAFGAKTIGTKDLGAGLLGALSGSQSGNTMPSDSTNTSAMSQSNIDPLSNTSDPSASLNGLTAPQQQTADPNDPFNPANISANVQNMIANGAKMSDVNSYLSMAQTMQKIQAAASPASKATAGYSKPSASQYSQGVSGMQSIGQLEQMLQQNPGVVAKNATPGQGLPLVGSLLSNAEGTAQYRALTHNILNSVARINTGANMPAEEESFYRNTYLPQPGDKPDVIATKMQNLQSFFQPIVQYPGGTGSVDPTDLLSALGGQ